MIFRKVLKITLHDHLIRYCFPLGIYQKTPEFAPHMASIWENLKITISGKLVINVHIISVQIHKVSHHSTRVNGKNSGAS